MKHISNPSNGISRILFDQITENMPIQIFDIQHRTYFVCSLFLHTINHEINFIYSINSAFIHINCQLNETNFKTHT